MTKSQLAVLIVSVVLTIVLFQLPKAIVKNDNKTLETKADNTKDNKEEEVHQNVMGEAQKTVIQNLHKKWKESKTAIEKSTLADSLYILFRNLQMLDSAAFYKASIAESDPQLMNLMLAGDAYLDAYKFSLDQNKMNLLAEKARGFYDQVLEKNPSLLDAKTKKGITYMSSQNPMQGIMLIREVLADDPKNEFAMLNMGLFSIQSKQYDKAVKRFEDLLAINPKNEEAQLYLSESYLNTGNKDKALEILDRLIQNSKDSLIREAALTFQQQIQQ